MNIVSLIIIIFTLVVSTLSYLWILKRQKNKWLGLFAAFCVNTLILIIATILLYKFDKITFHKEPDGLFGGLGILVFIFFIPVNTFINFYILEFVRSRAKQL